MSVYARRRELALARLDGAIAVIAGAGMVPRNGDNDFEFRQRSDFFYLTGFDEPDAVLVLAPNDTSHRTVLFLRDRDPASEIWDGARLGAERAPSELGVDAAYSLDELDARLPRLLAGAQTLFYDTGENEKLDRRIQAALDSARSSARRRGGAPGAIAQAAQILHPLRAIKHAEEIDAMRRAAAVTASGHAAGMRATRPGVFEYEVEAAIEYEYRRLGAQREAYTSIVAGGDNATTLHYSTNRNRLIDGELVLVDSGCELNYYASDVTRTWPVNGRFTAEQRAIYEIVLAAQAAAMAQVRPGAPYDAFHRAAVRRVTEGLIDVGLLRGGIDENIEEERYKTYFMHGTGHWLGMDVHDVGDYRDERGEPVAIEPGMVMTVEPGIYVRRELYCDERFKGIGVRIEDDLLVTERGYENLTAAIPKTIDDIERVVRSH
ncbi:MAG: aminopeptidase P N-terminal domain-containing protein [Candidatus Eremiobacteraeota bacterium]|nr:aminopeptidase P N-terminal domain-containing protein [Candidatus Eremiobacteraeota bacterium]